MILYGSYHFFLKCYIQFQGEALYLSEDIDVHLQDLSTGSFPEPIKSNCTLSVLFRSLGNTTGPIKPYAFDTGHNKRP